MEDEYFNNEENMKDLIICNQKHVPFVCQPYAHHHENGYDNDCNYCDYGLITCVVCGGSEGSLTTHCLGKKLDSVMEQMVAMGQADYINGIWFVPKHGVPNE